MTDESFNRGWVVRPKTSLFAQLAGPTDQAVPVTLPHDALIAQERAPEHGAGQAYFPGGCFEYSKTFDVPESWRTKRVALEFGGVYRDAVVFVNGAAAGQRPYGYSSFLVEPTRSCGMASRTPFGWRRVRTRTRAGTPARASTATRG